jgi:hypothetical protein
MIKLLAFSVFLLVGCVSFQSVSKETPPIFRFSPSGDGNTLQLTSDSDAIIINIFSESGIGSAEAELLEGRPPDDVTLRLHLKGLESFHLRVANQEQTVSFSSGATPQLTQSLSSAGVEQPLDPANPDWLEASIVAENPLPGIPLENGYFSISMPADLFKDGNKTFSIDWVDFYR